MNCLDPLDYPLLNARLREVADQTFEALAFLTPVAEAELADTVETVHATVSFTGPIAGEVLLSVPQTVLQPLAVNMLGACDGTPSPEEQQDALGEILNVICGNLLPLIAGREAVFSVVAPTVGQCVPPGASAPVAQATLTFEEGWATLALFLAESA